MSFFLFPFLSAPFKQNEKAGVERALFTQPKTLKSFESSDKANFNLCTTYLLPTQQPPQPGRADQVPGNTLEAMGAQNPTDRPAGSSKKFDFLSSPGLSGLIKKQGPRRFRAGMKVDGHGQKSVRHK